MDHAVDVSDNHDARRFEITVDGRIAGFAAYRRKPGQLVFTHTQMDDEFEGQGLGGRLIREALDSARGAGTSVVPLCPFVAAFIERHPEYADLVPESTDA
ncbi:GNAT family N-acetyltransferase [Sphaerisporangium corydalis]|uniref:GNAT family N-acetyltransferase n=1 Tax=Sphaerisporangium corydalis TaxID=1441875 RepID=A0ABV9ECQ2_9ACTN|nr:GNAT family N-acetyltransferase [Sphaerisporangium corydalis]